MKKELTVWGISMLLSLSMTSLCVGAAVPAATISAKDAAIEGFSLKDTEDEKPIEYLEDKDSIVGISETSSASYTLPEDFEEGNYDVYLQISKILNPPNIKNLPSRGVAPTGTCLQPPHDIENSSVLGGSSNWHILATAPRY